MSKDTSEITVIESKIIDCVIMKIDEYIKVLNPTRLVYIAFDGVAPLAKMEQQRSRRYKSWFMANINKPAQDKPLWNTSNITPGTRFMAELSRRINIAFVNSEHKYGLKKVVVSTSEERGEGEHKLFEYMRNNKEDHANSNVLVYGLDADLIMLSLFHKKYCKNIYICREAPQFVKSQIVIFNQTNDILFIDIDLLSRSIVLELSCKYSTKDRVNDYVFLCFLLGNDFLPHFPALNIRTHGIQVLMDTYRSLLGTYPDRYLMNDDGKINRKWLILFFRELAKNEHGFLLQEHAMRDKMDNYKFAQTTPQDKENMLLNTPILYRGVEKYICPQEKHWEDRYYMALFECKRTPDNIKKITDSYLSVLEWCAAYYTKGEVRMIRYEYSYGPLLKDISEHITELECEKPAEKEIMLTEKAQLHYVLPKSVYADIIGGVCCDGEAEEANMEYEWAYCRYIWEAHIKLPKVPLTVLEEWETQ
jgi:5'-3' exonuclease